MTERHIFKVAILTHDASLYEKLREGVFGVDFDKSYTETRGAAFAYSHFTIGQNRVTAQFWCLDATPQFAMVRNLYLKGSSGVIVLIDPKKKKAKEMTNRLLREYVSVNRYPSPMVLLSPKEGDTISKSAIGYAQEIQRWSGFEVQYLYMDERTEQTEIVLGNFMEKVKNWRARNVVFQAMKLYFDLDSITNQERSIDMIVSQLRQIYTNTYYKLIDDEKLKSLIIQAAKNEGFRLDQSNKNIDYTRTIRSDPFN